MDRADTVGRSQPELPYEVYPLEMLFSESLLQVVPSRGEAEEAAPVEREEDSEDSDFYADQ